MVLHLILSAYPRMNENGTVGVGLGTTAEQRIVAC